MSIAIVTGSSGLVGSEAVEFFDYNIIGLYAGEQNPVFLVSE